MAKQTVFMAVSNGFDGRDEKVIEYASLDENERDNWLSISSNKAYFTKTERIVNLETERNIVLSKLNGLERLALGVAIKKK